MNKILEMTPEEFNNAVQAKVDEVLSSREEAHARQEAENALTEAKATFEKLKAALEAKDAKLVEYEEALANFDNEGPSEIEVAANERIVELESLVEEYKHRSEVAEAALETLAREETAANRMFELEEAGIALEGDEAQKQYAKIRNLSDEDFEEYKSELIALRSKYASSNEEEVTSEVAELSEDEISMIAQSLGCDPQDSKCVSMVREVAEKMTEVSRNRKNTSANEESAGAGSNTSGSENKNKEENKETASLKKTLSLSEAISKSMDREISVSSDLRNELAQAWEERYAERRGEKKSK